MSIRFIRADVEKIVDKERELADGMFPPFHSAHEGWAVIREEMEELQTDVSKANDHLYALWHEVVLTDSVEDRTIVGFLESRAVNAACEAIQVAAMCRKFRALGNKP